MTSSLALLLGGKTLARPIEAPRESPRKAGTVDALDRIFILSRLSSTAWQPMAAVTVKTSRHAALQDCAEKMAHEGLLEIEIRRRGTPNIPTRYYRLTPAGAALK